jgi:excisionase family DNA binding protein
MEYVPASSVEHDEIYEPESLTVLQAARRAGVTQSAIIRWIRNGYLPATSSSNGWQIPASKLEEAHAAADASRGTGPVPRQTGPRLVPAPADLRQSLAVQAQEQPGRLGVVGEAIVSPLVELIRDQGDVVHDQAEVIGWLQAERSRLTAQLIELKQQEQQEQLTEREPAPAITDESTTSADGGMTPSVHSTDNPMCLSQMLFQLSQQRRMSQSLPSLNPK